MLPHCKGLRLGLLIKRPYCCCYCCCCLKCSKIRLLHVILRDLLLLLLLLMLITFTWGGENSKVILTNGTRNHYSKLNILHSLSYEFKKAPSRERYDYHSGCEGLDEDEEREDWEVVWTTVVVTVMSVPLDSIKTTFPQRRSVNWFNGSLLLNHFPLIILFKQEAKDKITR